MGIEMLLLILALVLFLLAAFGVPTRNVALGWLGLAVLTLIYILQGTARI
jgi:hypothetical protein